MLILHKTLPLLVSPIGLVLIISAASLVLKRPRGVWVALALLWAASMPITASMAVRAAEAHAVRHDPQALPQAQAIVVLSGMARTVASQAAPGYEREWGDGVDRFEAGLALWQAGKAPQLIHTAGQVPWDVLAQNEGQWLAAQALARGVPAQAIRLTPPVANTAEEARAVAQMLVPANGAAGGPAPGAHIILVTSAFHMPRARAQFEAQGLRVTPYPVDFRREQRAFTAMDLLPEASALNDTSLAVREAVGRVWYVLRRQ